MMAPDPGYGGGGINAVFKPSVYQVDTDNYVMSLLITPNNWIDATTCELG
jgi:hypothetical protein